MRRFGMLVSLVTAGVFVALPCSAQDQPQNPKRRALRNEVLKRFDKNGDGKLDETERQAAREAFQKRRGQQPAAGGRPGAEQARAAFMKRFDKNGDGKLDEAERKAAQDARQAMMKQFDKNGDGKLDAEEQKAAREAFMNRRGGPANRGAGQGRPEGPQGRLGRAELLKKFDENGDGKLDEQERAKAKAALREKAGGGK